MSLFRVGRANGSSNWSHPVRRADSVAVHRHQNTGDGISKHCMSGTRNEPVFLVGRSANVALNWGRGRYDYALLSDLHGRSPCRVENRGHLRYPGSVVHMLSKDNKILLHGKARERI
jgi:hypothetical protein